jgi:hypothetical protein
VIAAPELSRVDDLDKVTAQFQIKTAALAVRIGLWPVRHCEER